MNDLKQVILNDRDRTKFNITEDFDSFLVGPPPSFSLRLATELFFSFLPTWGTVSSSESELESVSSFFLFKIFFSILPALVALSN